MSDKKVNEKEKESNNFTPKKEFTKKVGNYIISEQIGIGTFSKVTKAFHTLTGETVAVKILDKSKIKDNIDIERISREIEILKSISHPNIAQLYESNSTIHNFYLIMEYIEGGDLCDYISKNLCLDEKTSCHFFRQLISVIEYLFDMGITHRDIKPENILLDASQKNIKVIDFGLSNYCADTELLKSACGSPCFASPEMLSGLPYNGITTDIWSSGIVLYSMLVGTLPFDDQELNALYEQIKVGTFYIPSTLSLQAIDFLKKILQVEPNKRINLLQIKEHPWFNLEKNILYKGIDLTIETFPYDEDLINYVIKRFFEHDKDINKNNFIKMIQYHACNHYTATYYLTEKFLNKLDGKILTDETNSDNNKELKISLLNNIDSKSINENEDKSNKDFNIIISDKKNDTIINNEDNKNKNNVTIINNKENDSTINHKDIVKKESETILNNKDNDIIVKDNNKNKGTIVNNMENIQNKSNENIQNNINRKKSRTIESFKEVVDNKINEKLDNNKDINFTKEKSVLKMQIKNKDKLNNTNESKIEKNNRSNSTNNKTKGKNLIICNFSKENNKINLIKKELISYKRSPYNYLKTKKMSFINNKKINLYPNADINKKLTHRVTAILDCFNNLKISENNSLLKKTESWQKKGKENYIIKKYKKEKNKILFDNKRITRNHYITYNFITDYHKKYENKNKSSNLIKSKRLAESFKKNQNISLTDRGIFSNSIFIDEPKIMSYNNSKINSIKTEKIQKNKSNVSPNNRRNISNNIKNKKMYENNSINITNNNILIKKEKKFNRKNIELNIVNTKNNQKFSKIDYNKYKKNIFIQANNININFKKLTLYNNHILTENKQEKKDIKFNKIKLPDSSHSLLYMKKKDFENKMSKNKNKNEYSIINKYKGLLDEFNEHNDNKNKRNKLKNIVSKLENEYFTVNTKNEEKLKLKNRNKKSLLINPSQNHSLSKTKNTNKIINYNINNLNQNYSNILDENNNKIKSKLIKTSLKNKKNLTINSGKYKLFQPIKYKKDNLRITINCTNYNLTKNNNISGLLLKNTLKKKKMMTNRKNSLNKRNYSSFLKTQKNSENKKIRNPFTQNVSLSQENNSNNNINRNTDNNKKIINININNILKINKKYSISLTKSNESSKNTIHFNNNTEAFDNRHLLSIKANYSSYPLTNDKRYKGTLIYYSNNHNFKNKNDLICPKMNNEQKSTKNYSSMLKKQLFEEQLISRNNKNL